MIPRNKVHLLEGVPLFLGNPHTLGWQTITQQQNYFEGKRKPTLSYEQLTSVKDDYVQLVLNYETAKKLNYMEFQNENFGPKRFYAFITKVEYVNTQVTRLYYEVDYLQSFYFDYSIQSSFVDRMHVRRYNTDGTPITYTATENLDYGTEYEIASMTQIKNMADFQFMVVVCKEQMHSDSTGDQSGKIKGSVVGIPQPLSYYILPFNLTVGNPSYYIGSTKVEVSKPVDFLTSMFTQEGAVDNVVSIYITDLFSSSVTLTNDSQLTFSASNYVKAEIADDVALNATCIYVKEIPEFGIAKSTTIGSKYSGLGTPSESKLLMYPYSFTEITDLKGNSTIIKNEYLTGSELNMTIFSGLAPTPKIIYKPTNYKVNAGITNNKAGLDFSLISDNPNDLPVLVDTLPAYLQGQRNQIENTKAQTIFNTITSVGAGAVGGFFMGGGVGATVGATGGMVSALGNEHYTIQGLLAKQKDIANTPPQMAKMGGNVSFDLGNRIYGLYVLKKRITSEYRDRLSDYFKMYGYKIGEMRSVSLTSKIRNNFQFFAIPDLIVTGNVPNDAIQDIKQRFNQGITIWWNGVNTFNYSLSNSEV